MGFLTDIGSLFTGVGGFFTMLRDMFGLLPGVVQVLIYFVFGGFLLLMLLRMLTERGR
jgi:phage-related protein